MEFLTIFAAYILAGAAGGVLLGLVGVGMALVGVPILILTLPLAGIPEQNAPLIALATSMGIVTMGSISSMISHHRLGNIDWPTVRLMAPFSVLGLIAGSAVATAAIPGSVLRWLLCLIEIWIAWTMLRPKKKKPVTPPPASPWHRRAIASVIGVSGSLIGAGGGVFLVPYLAKSDFPMRRAVATSVTIGFPVTTIGTLFYAFVAAPAGLPDMLGMIYTPALLGLGFGSMIGAPFGARLASSVDSEKLKKGFGILLIILAVNVVF